jgi:hypothetical protein
MTNRTARSSSKTPAVVAGPAATVGKDGRVLALTPSTYPELTDEGELWCAAHKALHPAKAFAYVTKRGAGKGRLVECRKAFEERLAANVEAREAGKPPTKAPHIDAAHVVPKPTKEAPKAARPAATAAVRAIDVPSEVRASA